MYSIVYSGIYESGRMFLSSATFDKSHEYSDLKSAIKDFRAFTCWMCAYLKVNKDSCIKMINISLFDDNCDTIMRESIYKEFLK